MFGQEPSKHSPASQGAEPDASCQSWIARVAKGKTFADVGGLWGTLNEKVTVAAKAGALSTAMIDITYVGHDLWQKFDDRCAAHGVRCGKNIQGDVNDSSFPEKVGVYDVVHCAGVIYHCPNPLYTVSQLSRVCSDVLILGTTIVPAVVENAKGRITVEQGGALLVPALDRAQREIIGQFYREVGASAMHGIDPAWEEPWDVNNYVPWWYLFTTGFVGGLLNGCGFQVKETYEEWGGRAAYFLAFRR